MDTSSEYIKMCEKAEEIQAEHFITLGDFYCPKGSLSSDSVSICDNDQLFSRAWQTAHIWLPRQDQLQEMIGGNCWQQWQGMNDYLLWQYWSNNVALNRWDSWEQLWLAFVMKEKYNKTWNGEEWVS